MANSNHQGRNSLGQFIQFGMVGGSGVFVNLFAMYLSKKIAEWGFGLHQNDVFMNLLGTSFNIRWYHIFVTIAFLVANTWNYQLNRMWTFKSSAVGWFRGYIAFLTTGVQAHQKRQDTRGKEGNISPKPAHCGGFKGPHAI